MHGAISRAWQSLLHSPFLTDRHLSRGWDSLTFLLPYALFEQKECPVASNFQKLVQNWISPLKHRETILSADNAFSKNQLSESSIDRKRLDFQGPLLGEAAALLPPARAADLDVLSSKISHKEKSLHKNAILHPPSPLDFSAKFDPDLLSYLRREIGFESALAWSIISSTKLSSLI